MSAVALYAFVRGFLVGLGVVLPPLLERLRGFPRLTAVVALGAWLSPIVLIALGHAIVSASLDRLDRSGGGVARGSWWAGLYSWLVALFATVTMFFAVAVIAPRPDPDPDALTRLLASASPAGADGVVLYSIVWIVIAALLYRVESATRAKGR